MKAPQPTNVALTVDERDAINTAKGRLRSLVALLSMVQTNDDDLYETEDLIGELADLMRESVDRLDAVFDGADRRVMGGAK